MKFKDQCDECKKFSYCRGYKGKVLCESCISEYIAKEENDNSIKLIIDEDVMEGQMTIFDFKEVEP